MAFKPIEPKRDEFRRYLESCGSVEAVTKVFAKLLAEEVEPEEPMEYITRNLGVILAQEHTLQKLNERLEVAKKQVKELKMVLSMKNISEIKH